MHGQYYSLCNYQQHNKTTAITHNEYTIFLDSWPKNLKNFLNARRSGQENIVEYFIKHHSAKHIKHVRTIYTNTDKMQRSVPLILLKFSLQGYVDKIYSKMEDKRKMDPDSVHVK